MITTTARIISLIATIAFLSCNKQKTNIIKEKPNTINSAAQLIISEMSKKDRKNIKETSPDQLIMYHHGWGTGIRNNLGLWGENKELIEDCGNTNPDDCSMKIINRIWQLLQDDKTQQQFGIDYLRLREKAEYEITEFAKSTPTKLDAFIVAKMAAFYAKECNGDSVQVAYISFSKGKSDSYADVRFILRGIDSIETVEPGFTVMPPDSVIEEIKRMGVYTNCEEP